MQELFLKNGTDPQRIKEIITVLSSYIDEEGMFNFKTFLSHLSWVQQKYKVIFYFLLWLFSICICFLQVKNEG